MPSTDFPTGNTETASSFWPSWGHTLRRAGSDGWASEYASRWNDPAPSRQVPSTRLNGIERVRDPRDADNDYWGYMPAATDVPRARPTNFYFTDETFNIPRSDVFEARLSSYANIINRAHTFTIPTMRWDPDDGISSEAAILEELAWSAKWSTAWNQIGRAHNAAVYCREVTYKDGILFTNESSCQSS